METSTSSDPPSFEKVWLLIQETQKQLQQTDRQLQQTDRQLQQTIQTLDRHIKETKKKLRYLDGLFTGQWGKLVESLVSGDMVRLLKERGIEVHQVYGRAEAFFAGKKLEIDILAANGEDVVAVEVKTTLWVKSVRRFVRKLKVLKQAFPLYQNKYLYGAIAFIRVEEKADLYAMRQGLFVIRATGKSASIINDKDFKPRVF